MNEIENIYFALHIYEQGKQANDVSKVLPIN